MIEGENHVGSRPCFMWQHGYIQPDWIKESPDESFVRGFLYPRFSSQSVRLHERERTAESDFYLLLQSLSIPVDTAGSFIIDATVVRLSHQFITSRVIINIIHCIRLRKAATTGELKRIAAGTH